jgi:LPXTG-motif cell wall-anchored protein
MEPGLPVLRNSPYLRTWRLAQRLKRGARNPYEFARRIDRYLDEGFRYDERPAPAPVGEAPLEHFLFEGKAGYCQHYSGAMALLLRFGGVPARVATGFSPGGFRRRQGEWVVRDRDAHSWVEAWFDGIGWVTFDPTPSATPARSLIAAISAPTQSGAEDSGADAAARQPGGRNPAGARRELDQPASGGTAADLAGEEGTSPWLYALAGLALLAVVAALLLWRRRRRPDGPAPADRAIADLVTALRRAGRPVPPGVTLTELERRLGGRGGYLTALRSARYGPTASGPTPGQRRAFRRELGEGLGWRGRVRAWWALPPTRR